MPISVTVPSSWPPSALERSSTTSETWNGRDSSKTSPAKILLSDCWPAMVMIIVANAPPTRSCPTGTLSSTSVIEMVRMAPISTIAYLTTAACADPVTDCSVSRARLATDRTAIVAKTKNAAAAAAAPIESPRCPGSNRLFRLRPNAWETAAAATANNVKIMARQGRARALTLATCFARSSCCFSCRSTVIPPPRCLPHGWGTLVCEAQFGPAASAADRIPPRVRRHSKYRDDRNPAAVRVGAGHHPLLPVDQHQQDG